MALAAFVLSQAARGAWFTRVSADFGLDATPPARGEMLGRALALYGEGGFHTSSRVAKSLSDSMAPPSEFAFYGGRVARGPQGAQRVSAAIPPGRDQPTVRQNVAGYQDSQSRAFERSRCAERVSVCP